MDVLLSLKQNGPFIIIYKFMDVKTIKKVYKIKKIRECMEIFFKKHISHKFCHLLYVKKSRFDLFKQYVNTDKCVKVLPYKGLFDQFDSYIYYKYMKNKTKYEMYMLYMLYKQISNDNKYIKKLFKEHNILFNFMLLHLNSNSYKATKYAKENNFKVQYYSSMFLVCRLMDYW